MNFKRIVAATDLSEEADVAVHQALHLARHTGAELVLVHAYQMTATQLNAAERSFGKPELFREMLHVALADTRKKLEECRERLLGQGVEVSHVLADAPAHEGICKAATELGADLIVIGTHGRTGIKRFLLGSVAERVVRHSPVSVLVARGDEAAGGFRNVLVPTDFSPLAEKALEAAKVVAAPGSLVDAVHFWQLPSTLVSYYGEGGAAVAPLIEAFEQDADNAGQALIAKHRSSGVELVFHKVQAPAAHGIQQYLLDNPTKTDFGIIVMGSHGHQGIRRLVLGSVAEATVRHSPCSVLVVKAES